MHADIDRRTGDGSSLSGPARPCEPDTVGQVNEHRYVRECSSIGRRAADTVPLRINSNRFAAWMRPGRMCGHCEQLNRHWKRS